MNKPSKCKNCQWYGKPYWSIINPCDNCPNEDINIEIFTRWQDPTIEEYKKEIERLNNIIDKADNKNLELIELINKIYDVIENKNITGIEARLKIQELLESKGE